MDSQVFTPLDKHCTWRNKNSEFRSLLWYNRNTYVITSDVRLRLGI